ncbi:MAG: hypothetical protein ACI9W4_003066 [Rhodothermales bacterium]|jgi:hypothetical protein
MRPKRAMPQATVLIFCFMMVSAASGQTRGGARIAGQVTHAESGSGLPDVHVFISGSTAGTTSNAEGRFTLEGVPLGANRRDGHIPGGI